MKLAIWNILFGLLLASILSSEMVGNQVANTAITLLMLLVSYVGIIIPMKKLSENSPILGGVITGLAVFVFPEVGEVLFQPYQRAVQLFVLKLLDY